MVWTAPRPAAATRTRATRSLVPAAWVSGWGKRPVGGGCGCAGIRANPFLPTETNQRKGVMGAGALLALLLGLLLSLLGCCCACRGKDPARR